MKEMFSRAVKKVAEKAKSARSGVNEIAGRVNPNLSRDIKDFNPINRLKDRLARNRSKNVENQSVGVDTEKDLLDDGGYQVELDHGLSEKEVAGYKKPEMPDPKTNPVKPNEVIIQKELKELTKEKRVAKINPAEEVREKVALALQLESLLIGGDKVEGVKDGLENLIQTLRQKISEITERHWINQQNINKIKDARRKGGQALNENSDYNTEVITGAEQQQRQLTISSLKGEITNLDFAKKVLIKKIQSIGEIIQIIDTMPNTITGHIQGYMALREKLNDPQLTDLKIWSDGRVGEIPEFNRELNKIISLFYKIEAVIQGIFDRASSRDLPYYVSGREVTLKEFVGYFPKYIKNNHAVDGGNVSGTRNAVDTTPAKAA